MIVKKYIQIFVIATAFLQANILFADWQLSIIAQDQSGAGSEDEIILGVCEGCQDGWDYGEDEFNLDFTGTTPYTDIYFFHQNWSGSVDDDGNICCDELKFTSDKRSIHPFSELISWGVFGSFGGGLDGNISINISWDIEEVNNLSDDYELFLHIGDEKSDMRQTSNISIDQEELYLNNVNDPNIKVVMGACASTGTTTHYLDEDYDGWGAGDISNDFCQGFAPEGWAPNSEDVDDSIPCESNLIDDCQVCVSPTHEFNEDVDCAGWCFGDAYEDDCSVCSGGDSGHLENTDKDCNGDCFGEAIIDDCSVCSGGESGHLENTDKDCNGDCFGTAEFDECGVCDGNGIPDGDCDCEGNNVVDCANVCGGTSTIETLCEDTDGDNLGNPGSETVECVDLVNNRFDGCDLPEFTLFLNNNGTVVYNSPLPFAGFQFDISGSTIIGHSGGDAESAGFFINYNESTAIGFSLSGELLPAGCGNLSTFTFDGGASVLSEIIVSNSSGNPISFSYYQANEFDLVADCSDEYPDCYYNYYDCSGDCGGSVEIDECGTCGGPGIIYCGGGIYECIEEDCPDTINYCLDLNEGANLISFYGLPNDESITNMMSSIEGIATGVIGEGVAANYSETLGWIGSLNMIGATSGYWVIVNDLSELCIEDAIPTNTSIEYSLHVGANLVSFPIEGSIEISVGLPDDVEWFINGIIGAGVAANYSDELGWIGSLSSFVGGNGYWVIATESVSFSFELSLLDRLNFNEPRGLTFPEGFESYQSTQQAFYFINEIKSESADDLNDGWIISFHNGKVTGSKLWTGDMIDIPVMGNDGNSYSEGYPQTGEIPQFKYLDNTTGKLIDLYHTDIPSWRNNGIYILGSVDVKSILPQTILLNAYPNPFNPATTLSFAVPNEGMLQLSIYTISGQLITELAHEYRTSGNVEYIWDAANHPSGIYLAQLKINNTIYIQKLMLIK